MSDAVERPPPQQQEERRRASHADNEAAPQLSSRDPISPLVAPPLSLGQLGDVGSRDAVVAAAAGSEQEQQFPEVGGFSLEVFQDPVPGPSRVPSVHTEQKRGSSISNRDGHVSAGHNLEGFLPCHDDLLPDAYPEPSSDDGSAAAAAALVDAPLSSSFQGMDAESSFGHPVDLEDIQLQRLLPEQYNPPSSATPSSSKSGDPAPGGSGSNGGGGGVSTSAPSSSGPSSKFLLSLPDLPSLPTLKGEDILPVQQNAAAAASTSSSPSSSGLMLHPNGGFGTNSEVSSGDERRSLNLGMAFTGIPTSMSSEPRASTSSSSGLNTNNNQQQHSSILESMTGPLSKRLRTLHTMQQQSKDEPQKSNGNGVGTENRSCEAAEAVAVVPQPSSSRSHNNGEDQQQNEPQQQQEQPTSNNNNNTKDGEPTNSGNSNDSNSSSDSSQPGSSGGPFLGGTTQTYSVTIETPPVAAVMKPKTIFHQKSLGDADLFDVFGKDTLEAGVATTITPTSIAMSRPRRQRKDRTVWCEECKMHYFECECPIHQAPLQIVDNPVESRARASVPSSHLSLRQLRNGENGIFTKQKIPKGSRFGPMEGALMRHTPSPSSFSSGNSRRLALLVRGPNKITYELDVTSEESSNWMRYVRPAGTAQEQNILLDQDGEHLFFTTSKAIGPKQELKAGYSPHYASEWGLHDENGEHSILPHNLYLSFADLDYLQ